MQYLCICTAGFPSNHVFGKYLPYSIFEFYGLNVANHYIFKCKRAAKIENGNGGGGIPVFPIN